MNLLRRTFNQVRNAFTDNTVPEIAPDAESHLNSNHSDPQLTAIIETYNNAFQGDKRSYAELLLQHFDVSFHIYENLNTLEVNNLLLQYFNHGEMTELLGFFRDIVTEDPLSFLHCIILFIDVIPNFFVVPELCFQALRNLDEYKLFFKSCEYTRFFSIGDIVDLYPSAMFPHVLQCCDERLQSEMDESEFLQMFVESKDIDWFLTILRASIFPLKEDYSFFGGFDDGEKRLWVDNSVYGRIVSDIRGLLGFFDNDTAMQFKLLSGIVFIGYKPFDIDSAMFHCKQSVLKTEKRIMCEPAHNEIMSNLTEEDPDRITLALKTIHEMVITNPVNIDAIMNLLEIETFLGMSLFHQRMLLRTVDFAVTSAMYIPVFLDGILDHCFRALESNDLRCIELYTELMQFLKKLISFIGPDASFAQCLLSFECFKHIFSNFKEYVTFEDAYDTSIAATACDVCDLVIQIGENNCSLVNNQEVLFPLLIYVSLKNDPAITHRITHILKRSLKQNCTNLIALFIVFFSTIAHHYSDTRLDYYKQVGIDTLVLLTSLVTPGSRLHKQFGKESGFFHSLSEMFSAGIISCSALKCFLQLSFFHSGEFTFDCSCFCSLFDTGIDIKQQAANIILQFIFSLWVDVNPFVLFHAFRDDIVGYEESLKDFFAIHERTVTIDPIDAIIGYGVWMRQGGTRIQKPYLAQFFLPLFLGRDDLSVPYLTCLAISSEATPHLCTDWTMCLLDVLEETLLPCVRMIWETDVSHDSAVSDEQREKFAYLGLTEDFLINIHDAKAMVTRAFDSKLSILMDEISNVEILLLRILTSVFRVRIESEALLRFYKDVIFLGYLSTYASDKQDPIANQLTTVFHAALKTFMDMFHSPTISSFFETDSRVFLSTLKLPRSGYFSFSFWLYVGYIPQQRHSVLSFVQNYNPQMKIVEPDITVTINTGGVMFLTYSNLRVAVCHEFPVAEWVHITVGASKTSLITSINGKTKQHNIRRVNKLRNTKYSILQGNVFDSSRYMVSIGHLYIFNESLSKDECSILASLRDYYGRFQVPISTISNSNLNLKSDLSQKYYYKLNHSKISSDNITVTHTVSRVIQSIDGSLLLFIPFDLVNKHDIDIINGLFRMLSHYLNEFSIVRSFEINNYVDYLLYFIDKTIDVWTRDTIDAVFSMLGGNAFIFTPEKLSALLSYMLHQLVHFERYDLLTCFFVKLEDSLSPTNIEVLLTIDIFQILSDLFLNVETGINDIVTASISSFLKRYLAEFDTLEQMSASIDNILVCAIGLSNLGETRVDTNCLMEFVYNMLDTVVFKNRTYVNNSLLFHLVSNVNVHKLLPIMLRLDEMQPDPHFPEKLLNITLWNMLSKPEACFSCFFTYIQKQPKPHPKLVDILIRLLRSENLDHMDAVTRWIAESKAVGPALERSRIIFCLLSLLPSNLRPLAFIHDEHALMNLNLGDEDDEREQYHNREYEAAVFQLVLTLTERSEGILDRFLSFDWDLDTLQHFLHYMASKLFKQQQKLISALVCRMVLLGFSSTDIGVSMSPGFHSDIERELPAFRERMNTHFLYFKNKESVWIDQRDALLTKFAAELDDVFSDFQVYYRKRTFVFLRLSQKVKSIDARWSMIQEELFAKLDINVFGNIDIPRAFFKDFGEQRPELSYFVPFRLTNDFCKYGYRCLFEPFVDFYDHFPYLPKIIRKQGFASSDHSLPLFLNHLLKAILSPATSVQHEITQPTGELHKGGISEALTASSIANVQQFFEPLVLYVNTYPINAVDALNVQLINNGLDPVCGVLVLLTDRLLFLKNYRLYKRDGVSSMPNEDNPLSAFSLCEVSTQLLRDSAQNNVAVFLSDYIGTYFDSQFTKDHIEIPFELLNGIHPQQHLLSNTAIEIDTVYGERVCVLFGSDRIRDVVLSNFKAFNLIDAEDNIETQTKRVQQQWVERKISNFTYLLELNALSHRSFLNLAQYPVFPWVLSDYTSEFINLSSEEAYRTLSKTMGAQDPERALIFRSRFEDSKQLGIPPFHYGTCMSSPGSTLFFLVRLPNFAPELITLQSGVFELPDRLFFSLKDAYESSALRGTTSVMELVPELFFLPEVYVNTANIFFGQQQSGVTVNDVVLPQWAGSPHLATWYMRKALELPIATRQLPSWIDLVFGKNRSGSGAEENLNMFMEQFYPELCIEKIAELERKGRDSSHVVEYIKNFGSVPDKLFHSDHQQQNEVLPYPFGVHSHPNCLRERHVLKVDYPAGAVTMHALRGLRVAPESGVWLNTTTFVSCRENGLMLGEYALDDCVYESSIEETFTGLTYDSERIIIGTSSGMMHVVSSSFALLRIVDGHLHPVAHIASVPSFDVLISIDVAGNVVVRRLKDFSIVRKIKTGLKPTCLTANFRNGDFIVCSHYEMHRYSINGEILAEHRFTSHRKHIIAISVTPLPSHLFSTVYVVGFNDGSVILMSCNIDGAFGPPEIKETPFPFIERNSFCPSRCKITGLTLQPDLKAIYIGYEDGNVYVIEFNDETTTQHWTKDTNAPNCHSCTKEFTSFNRRHHCRNCGNVFCGGCSKKRCCLPKLGFIHEKERVCDACFALEEQLRTM
ncbi:hypothetical protein PCE1_002656 [Barthelona sp. PCE]